MSNSFGLRLKRWRQNNNVKQEYFALQMGVSQATVSRWERGIDRPSLALSKKVNEIIYQGRSNMSVMMRNLVHSSQDLAAVIAEDLTVLEVSRGILREFNASDDSIFVGHHVRSFIMDGERDVLSRLGMEAKLHKEIDSLHFKSPADPLATEQTLYSANDIQIFHMGNEERFAIWRYSFLPISEESSVEFYQPSVQER